MKKIVLIGSGNVATAFARNIKERDEVSSQYTIIQVYSPNKTHAEELARQVDCEAISDCERVRQDADLYLFAVKDAALEAVVAQIPTNEGMWVHTSGSMPMDVQAVCRWMSSLHVRIGTGCFILCRPSRRDGISRSAMCPSSSNAMLKRTCLRWKH